MVKPSMKAVWIAAVENIDFPSVPGLNAAKLKAELDDILSVCEKSGIDTVMFHVRPTCDALYKSKLFPTSAYLVKNAGDPLPDGFDPLEYIISEGKKKGIGIHAWLNPYRITQGTKDNPKTDISMLPDGHPAKLHPEYTVAYADGKLYFNPAIPEVRKLIADGIEEIVANYDVDGIHFDDYFYPYPVVIGETEAEYDDEAQYKASNTKLSKPDFRRENVNLLIKECYDKIKSVKKDVLFGISPFAIWKNKKNDPQGSETNGFESFHKLYADSVAWVKGEYIDYICPQIYWASDTAAAPFMKLLEWWDNIVDGTNVALYVGHGLYRIESWTDKNELAKQLAADAGSKHCCGAVFFGYDKLRDNVYDCQTVIGNAW